MAFPINEYPYTDVHEMNMDWVLKILKDLVSRMDNFVQLNTIKYADPIAWDIANQYEANTVVFDAVNKKAYISTQPVPAGVQITNIDYWTIILDLTDFYNEIGDLTQLRTPSKDNLVNAINDTLFVTPEMFGALGDGVTDDSAAINAAIAASPYVIFKGSTYAINSPIAINSGLKKLIGNHSSIKCLSAINAFEINDSYYVNIEGFIIAGDGIGVNGIYSNVGMSKCTLSDLHIGGFTNNGIYLTKSWLVTIERVYCVNNAEYGIQLEQPYNVKVSGVNCNNNRVGMRVNTTDASIYDNIEVSGNTDTGLEIFGKSSEVRGLYYEDFDGYAASTIIKFITAYSGGLTLCDLHMTSKTSGVVYIDLSNADYNRINMRDVYYKLEGSNQILIKLNASDRTKCTVNLENQIEIDNPGSLPYTMYSGYGVIDGVSASSVVENGSPTSFAFGAPDNLGYPIRTASVSTKYIVHKFTASSSNTPISMNLDFKGIVEVTTRRGTASYYIDYTNGNSINTMPATSNASYFSDPNGSGIRIIASTSILLYFPNTCTDVDDIGFVKIYKVD